MNTQSHAILTFFLVRKGIDLTRIEVRNINPVLFTGALVPDLPLFLFFAFYTFISPTSQQVIWREVYFDHSWQIVFDLFHSLPFWGIAFVLFLAARLYRAAFFTLSALLASAQDLLVHYEDAHAHFFPFSDYRFASPVSYWNPKHYGREFAIIETLLVVAAGIWTYKRLESIWGKIILVLAIAALILSNSMWGYIFANL